MKMKIDVAGESPGIAGEPREFAYAKIDPTPPLVTLSLDDNTDVTEWFWEFIDQATGASAVLTTPMESTSTFTPTTAKPGTYTIRCTVIKNGIESSCENGVAWDTKNLSIRIPAARETSLFSATKGWQLALANALLAIDNIATGDVEAGVGLTMDGKIINVGDGSTGNIDGLAVGDNTLGVAVDDASLEIDGGSLQIKASGVGATELDQSDSYDFSTGAISVPAPTSNGHAASKEYVDQKLQGLEWQNSVLDIDMNDPPIDPDEGDRYIIGDTPTGVWVGHAYEIVEYQSTAWAFTTLHEGLACWVDSADKAYVYNGASWVTLASVVNHNSLAGIQGGTTDEYYHLNATEHTDVVDKLGDLVHKVSMAPSVNLTKSTGSPWTEDQVDDASAAIGDTIYIASDGHWERADSASSVTCLGIGIALEAGSGVKKIMLPGGVFRNDSWSWTPGLPLYTSATPGVLSHTPPGLGNTYIPSAIAKTATTILLLPSIAEIQVKGT
jgi:hypothetical protein